MRIAYIANTDIPSHSANSIQIMKMCNSFIEIGHETSLIVPASPKRQPESELSIQQYYGVSSGFRIHRIACPPHQNKKVWSWLAAAHAARLNPDLVYTRHLPSCLNAVNLGLPVVLEEHQKRFTQKDPWTRLVDGITTGFQTLQATLAPFVIPTDNGRLSSVSERLHSSGSAFQAVLSGSFLPRHQIYKRLSRASNLVELVVITHSLGHAIRSEFPNMEPKCIVAPDGADPPQQPAIEPAFCANNKMLNVGYCGHLYPGKGIELIYHLIQSAPHFFFHIVGGREIDVAYWSRQLASFENCHFYGHQHPKDVYGYLTHFDVCLLPNQPQVRPKGKRRSDIGQYTSPLKMFEYMACGKPIIASDLPVLKEVLSDEHNALLCHHDDPEAWLNALKRLAANENLRNRISENARYDFYRHYTWKARAHRVISAIRPDHPS